MQGPWSSGDGCRVPWVLEQGEGAGSVPETCSGSRQVERVAEALGQQPACWA